MTPKSSAQPSAREINRTLLQSVSNDWTFPPKNPAAPNVPTKEPVGYRERYYCSSDDDSDDDLDDLLGDGVALEHEDVAGGEPQQEVEQQPADTSSDALPSFESPDAVAAAVDRRMHARKRKKLRLLDEEAAYNEGLRFFLRRRDAWTCATPAPEGGGQLAGGEDGGARGKGDGDAPDAAAQPADADQSDPPADDARPRPATPPPERATDPPPASPSATAAAAVPEPSPAAAAPVPRDVLLPVAPPILPRTHAFRASLLERPDRELYEKLVRDGRTPAVPVNLAHMLRVIVRGWQDEGNWPPRGSAVGHAAAPGGGGAGGGAAVSGEVLSAFGGAGAGARKKAAGKAGRGAGGVVAARVAGPGAPVTGQATATAAAAAAAQNNALNRGILSGHKHLQQGVESVRRVLRFNSTAAPPGD
jgi:hypothetical protein